MLSILLLIFSYFTVSFPISEFTIASDDNFLSYPNKTIPMHTNVDSLKATSVPKMLNWTRNGYQHFIIFSELKFVRLIKIFLKSYSNLFYFVIACAYPKSLTTFVKPMTSDDIYGYCNSEISEEENEFIHAKCQKKLIKKDSIDCNQEYIVDTKKQEIPQIPKNETKNATDEYETNYFLWFLTIFCAVCFAILGADILRFTFYKHVQPWISNLYIRAPTDENQENL